MILCGCPNCKPYQKQEENPNNWAWPLPHEKRCNRYIEAINGARKMRTVAYDRDWGDDWDDITTYTGELIAAFNWWFVISRDPSKQVAFQR